MRSNVDIAEARPAMVALYTGRSQLGFLSRFVSRFCFTVLAVHLSLNPTILWYTVLGLVYPIRLL